MYELDDEIRIMDEIREFRFDFGREDALT